MAGSTTRGGSTSAPSSVDVARLAGVSQKTVSRVLNNEPYVSEQARRKVLEAAEALGYRLNKAARALVSGRTRSIGVASLGTALYGPATLLIGFERAARDTGYALRVVNTIEGDASGIAGAVGSLLEQGVEGIIISEPIDEGELTLALDVPVLMIGAPAPFAAPRVLTVGAGADMLARAATDHLLDLGHLTVHHLAGPERWYAARDRLESWRTALADRGRDEPPVVSGDWSAASGYAAGRELARDPGVTEAGRRVPEDVSVIGYDDIPVAAYMNPPLTTVRQPFDAIAHEGLGLLVHAIENPDADPIRASDPPVELVLRASTGPAPGHRDN
jgi:DNA-binding LacI/PurR family transcriptional regulator